MILCSILFPNLWKLIVYYFALFYYISKSLKNDCSKPSTVASYFLTCPESIFKRLRAFILAQTQVSRQRKKQSIAVLGKKAVLKTS